MICIYIKGYLDCILWAECDDNENPLDQVEGLGLSPEMAVELVEDCMLFLSSANSGEPEIHLNPLVEYWEIKGQTAESYQQLGHDLWLTRNGHGAGFWDRGLGELGDKLTEICKGLGGKYTYIGDDGLLYLS